MLVTLRVERVKLESWSMLAYQHTNLVNRQLTPVSCSDHALFILFFKIAI